MLPLLKGTKKFLEFISIKDKDDQNGDNVKLNFSLVALYLEG